MWAQAVTAEQEGGSRASQRASDLVQNSCKAFRCRGGVIRPSTKRRFVPTPKGTRCEVCYSAYTTANDYNSSFDVPGVHSYE
ncbi:hypothetical protein AMELA_G00059260 [Ameiurus melas]|uniref:Uncharacterized protein n=1 Tax=Ameiurus melas TaxID=219545 RepID=A0A7J6B125_AMEME|nr:hypothetical protein AMELA_G00059260 [Ameiurus melas]